MNRQILSVIGIVAALLIAGVVIGALYLGPRTNVVVISTSQTTTSPPSLTLTRTVTNTTTLVQSASGTCLKEVPESAVFSSYSNSSSQGNTVTFSNGTTDFFPLNSCPVPVTPDNYQIDSSVEANPKFIAAENGATYEANNACNCSWGGNSDNSTGQYATLNFNLYGNQQIYPCGPSSYWTFNRLGLILVIIPMNSTGALQFSNAEFQSLPGNNDFTCTTSTNAQTT